MKKLILLFLMMLSQLSVMAEIVEINGINYNLISKLKIAEVTNNQNNTKDVIVIPEVITYNDIEYSVTSIESDAFKNCALSKLYVTRRVTTIGNSAFSNCANLNYVSLSYSVTSIGKYAFAGCNKLNTINIPINLTTIDDFVFQGCTSLTSIKIPESVTSIRQNAFEGCVNLTAVHISNLDSWCKIVFATSSSNPLWYAKHLFINEQEITNLEIPNSVTTVSDYAFVSCVGLSSVSIPDCVVSIGKYAFRQCSGLKSVVFPNSLTTIDDYAFEQCVSLESIELPNSITTIGTNAFYGCTGLKSIILSNSLTSVTGFRECTSLTSITIPNSVTTISSYCFYGCSNLKTVIIGSGVNQIKTNAFASCQEILDVYCNAKDVPITNNDAFQNSYIESAMLHVPKVSIGSYKSVEPWKNFKNIVKIDYPEHTLTYMVDGEVYKTYQIEEGETIVPENEPTKEGYTFSGWSEIPETMPAHDVTVTGTFAINTYKLTYMVDNEVYKTFDVKYGETITPEPAPTKEGYTFSGWSEIPATMPAHDVTVTGTFAINTYKLTYMVDDEVYKTYDVKYGDPITPEPAPTKEGYTFSGWSVIPETMPAHDVTVTGSFTIDTGIKQIMSELNNGAVIYTLDGKRISGPRKGMNIVRMTDGTTRKVVVK